MKDNNENNTPEKVNNIEEEAELLTLDSLKLVIEDLKNKNLVLLADMENLRKRFDKEKSEIIKYSALNFLENLLPSLEMFEMALSMKEVSEETKK